MIGLGILLCLSFLCNYGLFLYCQFIHRKEAETKAKLKYVIEVLASSKINLYV